MSRFRNAAALILFAGGLLLTASGWTTPVQQVGARQLVRSVDTALEGAAQSAQRGLDPRDARYAPFWHALNGMRTRLGLIETALESRDPKFFDLVDLGSADLGALRVAWARMGAANAQVAEGIRIASTSFRLLRANYGREGIRHRQGGELTEAERRQFQRVQRAQRRFAESLRSLRDRSRQQGDEVTAAELDRYRLEAERIAWASLTLEAYLNSLITSSEMRGEWEAGAPHIRKTAAPEEWAQSEEAVEDLYVSSDIGHVFTLDLGTAPSHLDQETEVAADGPVSLPAIQIFEPGEDDVVLEEDDGPVEGIEFVSGSILEAPVEEAAPADEDETDAAEAPAEEILEEEDLPEEGPLEDAQITLPAEPAEAGSKTEPASPAPEPPLFRSIG